MSLKKKDKQKLKELNNMQHRKNNKQTKKQTKKLGNKKLKYDLIN